MQTNNKRFRIEEPMAVVVRGAFNQGREEQGEEMYPTINKKNVVPHSEKEVRRLCDDALMGINVLRRSEQDEGKEKVFQALRLNGFHRINEAGFSRKRDELYSIKAKAIEYANAIPSSTTDLSSLSEAERNSITQYRAKNLPNIENRIERIVQEEVEITRQLNELNRRHYLNLKEQQYLLDIHKDVKYNINGEFISLCIDSFISSLNNNINYGHIVRERNIVIDDLHVEVDRSQRIVRLDDSAILGTDLARLNVNGEMDL